MDTVMIGKRIRLARRKHNMTADVLAEQINLEVASLRHIECGARKTSLQTLINIADVLDVSLDYLTGRTPSPTDIVNPDIISSEQLTKEQKIMLESLVKHLLPFIKEYN